MKKMLIAIVLLMSVVLASCGNMGIGIGNYSYNGVHIDAYNGGGCYDIEKWYDCSNGIEVSIKGGNAIFISEGTVYILYENECPICGKGE